MYNLQIRFEQFSEQKKLNKCWIDRTELPVNDNTKSSQEYMYIFGSF